MDYIAEFLELYNKRSTQMNYQGGIRSFLDFVYDHTRVNDTEEYERLSERYLTEAREEKRQVARDIIKFADSIKDKPPFSIRVKITAVREWLGFHGFELTKQENKNIRKKIPKGYARTVETNMTKEILQQILHFCDLKNRALYLCLVSSGMRIGEALLLEDDDINYESTPIEITIRGENTKTGQPRTTFISQEAGLALQAWNKVRAQTVEKSMKRNIGLTQTGRSVIKQANLDRVFPYSYWDFNTAWNTAVKRAELFSRDRKTNRKQLRIHQLRKFFRTQCAQKIPVDVVEHLMGHSGYLTDAYRRYQPNQIRDFYLKAEPMVTINMQEDLETRSQITALAAENTELRNRLSAIEQRVQDVKNITATTDEKLREITQDPIQLQKMMDIMKELMQKQSA